MLLLGAAAGTEPEEPGAAEPEAKQEERTEEAPATAGDRPTRPGGEEEEKVGGTGGGGEGSTLSVLYGAEPKLW